MSFAQRKYDAKNIFFYISFADKKKVQGSFEKLQTYPSEISQEYSIKAYLTIWLVNVFWHF